LPFTSASIMPEGLKTVDAIKEDAANAKKRGDELIKAGKAKVVDGSEAMKEDAAKLKKSGEELINSGRSKVADSVEAVKNAVEPPHEPTFYEKTVEKMGDAFQTVKEATVGK